MRPYYLDVLEKRVTGKDLLRELFRRAKARLLPAPKADRQYWTPADVIDADGPELGLRCYLEHRDLRAVIAEIPAERRKTGVEIGCGYGRLTVVLQEFFARTVGIEREEGLLRIARVLTPQIEYVLTPSLSQLAALTGPVDFAMIFTVLTHMTDAQAQEVLAAMKQKVGRGWILIVEHTDPAERTGDTSDCAQFMVQGRPVAVFEEWMKPFKLVKTLSRTIEPTYVRKDVGQYMLFLNS